MKLGAFLKLQLKINFSFKRFFGFDLKENKAKTILISVALVYGVVAMIGTFGFLFFDLGKILAEMNQMQVMLSFATVYGLMFTVFTVLLSASGYLFYYKDYQILSPLPIHTRTVFIAKLMMLLILILGMNYLVTLPIIFSYFYHAGFDLISLIIYLIGFLFIPLIPLMVTSFLSLALALFASRFRYAKILNLILMIGVLVGVMYFSFSFNESTVNPLTGQIDLFSSFTKYYLPFKWFNEAVYNQSFLDLSYLILSHIALFIGFVYGVEKLAHYTNKKGLKSAIKYKQKTVIYQQKPILNSLVQKEFKKFFSSTIYALNSGVGIVMLAIAGVASIVAKDDLQALLSNEFGVTISGEPMILVLMAFTIGMTFTPAVSLSLEGKNLWILKSLPIKASKVMLSKIVFNLWLVLPVATLSLLMMSIALSISFLNIILLWILIVVFAILTSTLDAIINMYMPKFDYQNETEVVKQSASSLLAVFGTFGIMAIFGGLYYLLYDVMDVSYILIILILTAGLVTLSLIYVIKTKAEGLFLKYK